MMTLLTILRRLMVRSAHVGICLVLVLPSAGAQRSMTPAAAAYLATSLDTIAAVTIGRDTIAWGPIRDSAFAFAAGAQRPEDTYGAINWALRRANKHAFLQAPSVGVVAEHLEGEVGYIRVPRVSGAGQAVADSLHAAVGRLDAAGSCGWIVDLRANGGGNMWPMAVGIGPLLGDSLFGSFGAAMDSDVWFYRDGTSAVRKADGRLDTLSSVTVPVVHIRYPGAPVAVLIDGGTGSSGEAIAAAFLGRPRTRFFGEPTAGYATTNRGSRLSNGANMVVTIGYYTDRTGRELSDRIEPDQHLDGPPYGWPSFTDRVTVVAAEWVRRACRSTGTTGAL